MTTQTLKNAAVEARYKLETLFLLSPLAVMLLAIFNLGGTKSILSRLIPVVAIYCLWRYRDAIKQNWYNAKARPFLITSIIAFWYFGLAHLLRDDEFGYSRTLLTCLAYLLFVPWSRFSRGQLSGVLVFAAIFCGLNAIYEFWGLGIHRVGIATNPIPYALFCACLALCSLNQLLTTSSWVWRFASIVGLGLSATALVLTDVRGVLLFIPVVLGFLAIRVLPVSRRTYTLGAAALVALCAWAYSLFQDKIDARLAATDWEFAQIEKGNFNTSIGIRLTLWKGALETFSNNPVVGAGDFGLKEDMSNLPIRSAKIHPHAHNQFLDTLGRYGALGLLVLLAWLISPLLYIKAQGGIGVKFDPLLSSVILMVVFASLTDVPFHHTHLVYFFALFAGTWLLIPNEECGVKPLSSGV